MDAKKEALEQARELIGNIVSAAGPYPYVNNTELVKDAYKLLGTIDAALRTQIIGPVWVKELDRLRAEVASLKEEKQKFWQRLKTTSKEFVSFINGEHSAVCTERDTLTQQLAAANGRVERMREAMARAKKLPVWDSVPHALHVELDVIFASLSALPQQVKSEDARDAARYRLLREYEIDSYIARGSHEKLDSEVDAAISAQEPKQ